MSVGRDLMAEQKKRVPKAKKPPKRREGFIRKSGAVNLTIWDGYGNVIPDDVATDIINSVNELATKQGYLFSFTRE
jgi:hypothetical protein